MSAPTIVVAGEPSTSAQKLDKLMGRSVTIRPMGADLERISASTDAVKAALVVISLGSDPEAGLEATRLLSAREAKVLVIGSDKNADVILAAMRAGAREFIVDGQDEDLRKAIKSIALSSEAGMGTVTAVFSAKGGVGATSIATNLAGSLHRAGDERVGLVDLDLYFGDIMSFLDLPGGYSISDVVSNLRRLDRELLDSSVTRHRSGVWVLAQSEKLEQAETIKPDDVQMLVTFLRQQYNHVVLDGLRGLDEITVSALDASDTIMVVVTQDVPAVRNAQRCMRIFEQLGYTADKVRLLVNRYQKKSTISLDVISETVGVPVDATLSNDFAALIKAINHGVLLAEETPRSKLTKDIANLAASLRGDGTAARSGMFSNLRRSTAHGA